VNHIISGFKTTYSVQDLACRLLFDIAALRNFPQFVVREYTTDHPIMASNAKIQNVKRKKLLHRFYEPLLLLFVLDRTQGGHLARPTSERLPLDGITEQELRRRALDALAYLCDFEKGGDTTTAVMLALAPLTYFVSSNKTLNENVKPFLQTILKRLEAVYREDHEQRKRSNNEILQACVGFSETRLTEYWKLLQAASEKCQGLSSERSANNSKWMLLESVIFSFLRYFQIYSWWHSDLQRAALRIMISVVAVIHS
jgi:hypothetical protein